MMPFFLSLILTFSSAVHVSAERTTVTAISSKVENASFYVVQTQNSESLEEGDEETYRPYTGFNILALGMIAVIILMIAFVVMKVFKRMNKSRRYEGEGKKGRGSIKNRNTGDDNLP